MLSPALPGFGGLGIILHTIPSEMGYNQRGHPAVMNPRKRERLLTSLLWGGVAAAGQYTMLFLTIIQRIHVQFPAGIPEFYVDPRGPIRLTKDEALTAVWALTTVYAVVVFILIYVRPHLGRQARIAFGLLAIAFSALTALADPLWGLIILADFALLYPLLKDRMRGIPSP